MLARKSWTHISNQSIVAVLEKLTNGLDVTVTRCYREGLGPFDVSSRHVTQGFREGPSAGGATRENGASPRFACVYVSFGVCHHHVRPVYDSRVEIRHLDLTMYDA